MLPSHKLPPQKAGTLITSVRSSRRFSNCLASATSFVLASLPIQTRQYSPSSCAVPSRATSGCRGDMIRHLQLQWPDINDGYIYTDEYISRRQQAGGCKHTTVLELYCNKHADSGTQQQWQARIAKGQVFVNGVVATAGQFLRHADKLSYQRLPWKEPDSPNFVDVLYEDAHVVALNKPTGLQVLPAAQHQQRTVLTLLQRCYHADMAHASLKCPQGLDVMPGQAACTGTEEQDCSNLSAAPQSVQSAAQLLDCNSTSSSTAVVPVHRLGKGTSGLLLCACSQQAKQRLADVMTHTTVADMRSSTDTVKHTVHADAGDSSAAVSYSWPGPHTQHSVMVDAAGQVPAGAVRKVYRTRVQGIVQSDTGEVCVPVGRVEYPGVRGGLWAACPHQDSDAATPQPTTGTGQTEEKRAAAAACTMAGHSIVQRGKAARSKWSVVYRDVLTNTSLLNVEIFTGRPHQIRIHMAATGHPLVGEPLYVPGGVPAQPQSQQELSAMTNAAVGQPIIDSQTASQPTSAFNIDCSDSNLDWGADTKPVVPGDGGYLLHSWQLLLHHPVVPDKVLHLAAPLPEELKAPWELCS